MELSLLGKQLTKAELRTQIDLQLKQAMFMGDANHTLYAPAPPPTKRKYKPRKPRNDAYQAELAKLEQAQRADCSDQPAAPEPSEQSADGYDISALALEAAAYQRRRSRK